MINQITLNTTHPVKYEDMSVELNKLSLMTGANGVGKTFILINCYCISLIACAEGNPHIIEMAQYIYDKSFTNQDIDGDVTLTVDGKNATVTLERGKVKSVEVDKEISAQPIIYMSAAMRLFSAISTYLCMRKMMVGDEKQIIEGMLNTYRLYDVMYIEGLIKKCPIDITPDQDLALERMDITDMVAQIGIDLEKCDFYAVTRDGIKWLSTYSNGEQSIINMIIGIS